MTSTAPAERMNARGIARRTLLLEAAARVVAGGGVEGLTHRAVAGQAGVSLASATYHFPTIVDLRRETLEHVARTLGEKFDATFVCPVSPQGAELESAAREPAVLREAVATLVSRWVHIGRDHCDELVALVSFLTASLHDTELKPACKDALAVPVGILRTLGCDPDRAKMLVGSLLGLAVTALLQDDGGRGPQWRDSTTFGTAKEPVGTETSVEAGDGAGTIAGQFEAGAAMLIAGLGCA